MVVKIIRIAIDAMTPWEAMGVLGLDSLAGQVLTKEVLRDAYAPLILEAHPDKNPGQEEAAHEKSVRINNAKDILKRYIGQPLPSDAAAVAPPPPSPESEGFDDWYTNFLRSNNLATGPQDRPPGAMTVNEAQVLEWVGKIFAANLRQVFIRGHYQGFELMSRFGVSPYGPKIKTQRISDDVTPDRLFESIKRMIKGFPESVIDMQIGTSKQVPEAWITWLDNEGERGSWMVRYRSLSFEPIPKKVVKPAGVGLTIERVDEILRTRGLKVTAGGDKYSYWSRQKGDKYCIRQAAKTLRLMKRIPGEWVPVTGEFYYGKLTEAMVAKMIEIIDQGNGVKPPTPSTPSNPPVNQPPSTGEPPTTAGAVGFKKASSFFVVPPNVPHEFAMAVYRVMHNQATADDWGLLDVQPNALETVRLVLQANQVENIEAEMAWWSRHLSIARN